jgi:hypothetical protein
VKATVALAGYTVESFDEGARTGFRAAVASRVGTQLEAVVITGVGPANMFAAARRKLVSGGIDIQFTVTSVQQSAAAAIQTKTVALKQDDAELVTFASDLKVQIQAAGGAPPPGGFDALVVEVKTVSAVVESENPVYSAAFPPEESSSNTALFAAIAGVVGALAGTLIFKKMSRSSASVAVTLEDTLDKNDATETTMSKPPSESAADLLNLPLPPISPQHALPPIRQQPRSTLPPLVRTQQPTLAAGEEGCKLEPLTSDEIAALPLDRCAARLVLILDALVKAVASKDAPDDTKWLEGEAEVLGARFESDAQMELSMQQVRRRNAAARLEARMKARSAAADSTAGHSPASATIYEGRLDEIAKKHKAKREDATTTEKQLSDLKNSLKARFGDD